MARQFIAAAMMGLILCVLPGCSSEQEKAVDKQISMTNEFADDLSKIKTNTDLVNAKPDLEKLGAKMKDLQNEIDKMPKPTADEQTAIDKKYKTDKDKAEARIDDEMKRITKDVSPTAPFEILEAMHIENLMGSSPFGNSPKMPM